MRPILVATVLLIAIALAVSGCKSESEHDQMIKMVKKSLKDEGIQGGVEPEVELKGKGNDWIGTATYGEIVYDVRVYKNSSGDLMLERTMRAPKK